MAPRNTAATIEKTLPASEKLSAEEQKYFDTGGEDGPEAPEPVARPTPAPEPEIEEVAEPEVIEPEVAQTTPQKQSVVPHAALHQEREAHKETKERLKELEKRTNLILEKFGQPTQAPQQQVQQPVKQNEIVIPALEEDPLGHIVGQMQLLAKNQDQIGQTLEQRNQQEQQTNQIRQLTNTAVSMEQEFAKATPDYNEAASYLQNGRRQEYMAMGYNEMQASQAIQQEALQIANMAIARGQNPAEVIYNVAKSRGFQKAAAPAPETVQEPGALPPIVPSPENSAKIATIAQGQKLNQSLGNARGSAPAPMTAQRLLELSPDEFAKVLNTPEGRALMGA